LPSSQLGWVAEEALAFGLYAALVAPLFDDTIRVATNHGGDSDSTAFIAGQLYGAWKGMDGPPHRLGPSSRDLDPALDLIGRLERTGQLAASRSIRGGWKEAVGRPTSDKW
jgi:ADP-ribosylglycohydrolase